MRKLFAWKKEIANDEEEEEEDQETKEEKRRTVMKRLSNWGIEHDSESEDEVLVLIKLISFDNG